MNPKAVQRIDQALQLDNHLNYFKYAKNMCFTSIDLKLKRILAYLIKKLSLLPDSTEQIIGALLLLFEKWQIHLERVELDLLELLDNNLLGTEERQNLCIRIYKWLIEVFKRNYDKQFICIARLAMILLCFEQETELRSLISQQGYTFYNMNNPNWHYLLLVVKDIVPDAVKEDAISNIYQKYLESHVHIFKKRIEELMENKEYVQVQAMIDNYRYNSTRTNPQLNCLLLRACVLGKLPIEVT